MEDQNMQTPAVDPQTPVEGGEAQEVTQPEAPVSEPAAPVEEQQA